MNEAAALPTISPHEIGGDLVQTVILRDLHAALEVGRDFSNWIKDRIEKYNFLENQDFVCSPILASEGRGGHNRLDYFGTLDMAKELAMVENNETGRRCRRHFIECERRLKAGTGTALDMRDPQQLARAALQLVEINSELVVERDAALKQVAAVKPKVEAYNRFLDAQGADLLSVASIKLGMPQKVFFDTLKQDVLIYRDGDLVPRSQFRGQGLIVVRSVMRGGRLRHETRVTARGLDWLARRLGVAQPDFFTLPSPSEQGRAS